MNAQEILEQEFLLARAKILELAAIFDRLDRCEDDVQNDKRMKLLHQGISALQDNRDNRAEEIQLIFSRSYEEDWKSTFGV